MILPPDTLAAIDVGTNSFHLVVARMLGENRFTVIAKEKVVVRLGESPSQIKKISSEAIERGVDAMRLLQTIAERFDAPIRAVATSAVREANNGEEFITAVRAATGIEVEVISGFEEARLIYLGLLQALPVFNERIAFFDIGGGSTEFLVGEQGRIQYANSFKIGAIRMTQRFFPEERVTQEQLQSCRLFLRGEIYHAVEEIRRSGVRSLIATSGTAQTVAAMAVTARGEEVPESLNGLVVRAAEIDRVVDRILRCRTHEERRQIPGVDPRRADILVAGAVTLATIVQECGVDSITISTYALREGIVLDTIQQIEGNNSGAAHLSDLRYETVMRIGRMYDFDLPHGRKVADLALSIYDALEPLHRLEERSREHLEAAALLHDIGYYISHSSHHKHSYYLIVNSEALGFTNEELAIIGNVARYHRKSHPKKGHANFATLRPGEQARIRTMAAILRVADGLDRTHKGNVERVETTYDGDTITFRIHCSPSCSPTFEIWSADRKKGLMEEVFKRSVRLELVEVGSLVEPTEEV